MNNRIDAIYARQSVDKKDSISIESQIEFCKYELKGGNYKESHPHMAGGENQVRELRICPYEYLQSLRQAIPPLYETACGITRIFMSVRRGGCRFR